MTRRWHGFDDKTTFYWQFKLNFIICSISLVLYFKCFTIIFYMFLAIYFIIYSIQLFRTRLIIEMDKPWISNSFRLQFDNIENRMSTTAINPIRRPHYPCILITQISTGWDPATAATTDHSDSCQGGGLWRQEIRLWEMLPCVQT